MGAAVMAAGFSGLNMASVTLRGNMTMQETGHEGQFVVTGHRCGRYAHQRFSYRPLPSCSDLTVPAFGLAWKPTDAACCNGTCRNPGRLLSGSARTAFRLREPARRRVGLASTRSGQILREEFQRAALCQLVVGLAVAAAFVAAEPVAGALVDVAVDLRLRGADRVHIGHRDRGIGLAEMHLHRAIRPLILGPGDAAAVPAGGARETLAARGAPPRDRAAKAITDNPDLLARQMSGRRLDIQHQLLVVQFHAHVAAFGDVVRRVADFEPLLDPVVTRRERPRHNRRRQTGQPCRACDD